MSSVPWAEGDMETERVRDKRKAGMLSNEDKIDKSTVFYWECMTYKPLCVLYLDALQRQDHAYIATHAVDLDGQLDLHVDQTGFAQLCPVCVTACRLAQVQGFMEPGQE